jgi:hypothetical protein
MTDQQPPTAPDMPTPAPPAPIEVPPPPPPPPAKQPSKLRTYLSVGVLVAILAVVLYAVRNSQDAGALAIGTCFDVPSASDFSTVTKFECTEPHDAEVIFVGELTGDSYPITLTLDNFIDANCVPAAVSYVGRPAEEITELQLGYFSPTRDAFEDGERTMTCYLYVVNEAKLTKSVKAGT